MNILIFIALLQIKLLSIIPGKKTVLFNFLPNLLGRFRWDDSPNLFKKKWENKFFVWDFKMIVDGWMGDIFILIVLLLIILLRVFLRRILSHFFLSCFVFIVVNKVNCADGLASQRFRWILKEEAPVGSLYPPLSLFLSLSLSLSCLWSLYLHVWK